MAKQPEFDGFDISEDPLEDEYSLILLEGLVRARKSPYEEILKDRPRVDAVAFINDIRKAIHFKELDEDLVVTEDPVGLKRVLDDGTVETYPEKMKKERAKGRNEAVSYGLGKVGDHEFVAVIHNKEFMAGTSGVVAGEKNIRAVDLATEKHLPIVVFCPSGGQRQQEGVVALREMPRGVFFYEKFKRDTNQPVIYVLMGTWGGLMASKREDLAIGIAGSDAGFAGPPVIEAYEGRKPPEGAQSIENIAETNRNIHVVLNTPKEVLEYLEKLFDMMAKKNQPPERPKSFHEITGIHFDQSRYHVPFRPDRVLRNHPRVSIPLPLEPINPETVWDQHKVLKSDPRRPDTLYILQHAFDGFVPLFSGRVEEDNKGKHLKYPAIVAALAYIDDPRLQKRLTRMVIGNQPSYVQQADGTIIMKLASPTAWDYRYQIAMMRNGQRWGYQLTSLVNTLGARPKLIDDLTAQFEAISDCQARQMDFPYPTSGYLIGIGGSGGHIATDFVADYTAMLSGAQEFVAEPNSAAAILYSGKRRPTGEDIIRIAEGMQPTAQFLFSRGLIDRIISEPEGGAQNNPLATAHSIREDIIQTEISLGLGNLTPEELLARREKRFRKSRPIPIGYLDGREGFPTSDHKIRKLDQLPFHKALLKRVQDFVGKLSS